MLSTFFGSLNNFHKIDFNSSVVMFHFRFIPSFSSAVIIALLSDSLLILFRVISIFSCFISALVPFHVADCVPTPHPAHAVHHDDLAFFQSSIISSSDTL